MNLKPKLRTNKILSIFTIAAVLLLSWAYLISPNTAQAGSASLSMTPNSGTFVIDSTFEVSVYLDTQGQAVNTIELNIKYPQDKVQLVSSSTGKSIIGIWTSQPHFNNETGRIELTGGIPGGVNVSRGLITTMTFRVRSVGSGVIKFDNSRVLLNDGLGTEILTQNYNSIYEFVFPPPAGPTVISETHPDQGKWYNGKDAILKWEGGYEAFSYILNDTPVDTPDNIAEGIKRDIIYQNLSDGRHYFHIRGLRGSIWGGVTHYALNIDASPPAEFKIDIIPSPKTARKQPVIQFATTDANSGLDHYELQIVNLNLRSSEDNPQKEEGFFIEAESPYVPNDVEFGKYDVIVRAFDKSGNIREVIQRMEIVPAVFRFVANQGLEIKSSLIIPWYLLWLLLLLILGILFYIAYRLHLWQDFIEHRRKHKVLPDDLHKQMLELQKYRDRYGKIAVVLLLASSLFGISDKAWAAEKEDKILGPPLITTIAEHITNDEIFYVGGKTGISNSDVIVYLQNLQSSATVSFTVKADKNGDWFYRTEGFLTPGEYLLWSQSKVGEQLSPPSPQTHLSVEATALQFGASRFSYATIYGILSLLMCVVVLLLGAYVIYHYRHGRRKHRLLMKELSEAEASIRRGFAVLNRDIQSELAIIKRAKLTKDLSEEQIQKEQQLLNDLKEVEQYISKEIWEIEDTEVRV